jgi:oxaloacetate decarboxylase alpha subunit
MTPFSQIVLTQAVMNVTGAERYGVVPDELIRYALGRFGKPTVPIEPAVMEKIESLPRTRELRAEAHMLPLKELRERIGPWLSDEEFLLRATMAARHYDPSRKPLMGLIRTLTARRDLWSVSLEKTGFRLTLSRSETPSRADTA